MPEAIAARGLSFTYRGSARPGLSAAAGEIIGLLGPSGAGKSTLQRVLTGLLTGYRGSARVLGREIADWGREVYERIGVAFETPVSFGRLTLRENLAYTARLYRGPVRDPEGLLAAVDLADAADLRALPRAVAHGGGWLPWALGSAVFAALTAVLGKIGITDVESNLGTAVRTGVVLVMAWMMVLVTGKRERVRRVPRDELGWIAASGLATGASWLCYFSALQKGPASLVVPIDKLSVLVTVVFCVIVLHERQGRRSLTGLALLVIGTALMVVA